MNQLVVRHNPVLGAVLLVVGLGNLLLSLLAGGDGFGTVSGAVLTVIGLLFLLGKAVVIRPAEVIVKSVAQTTIKIVPIDSPADLTLDDNVLRLRADGKKIVNLGWGGARRSDVEALRVALEQGQQ